MTISRVTRSFVRLVLTGNLRGLLAAWSRRFAPGMFAFAAADVFEQELGPGPAPATGRLAVTFATATSADLSELRALHVPPRLARRRLARGDECVVARTAGGEVVYMAWIHYGPCFVSEFAYAITDRHGAYIYNVRTHEAARRQGINRAGLCYAVGLLRQRGITAARLLVGPQNVPMLHAVADLGYRRRASVRHRALFWVKFTSIHDLVSGRSERHVLLRRPREMAALASH